MRQLLMASALLAASAAAPAQDSAPKPKPVPQEAHIGVVDMDRIGAESLTGKRYAGQIAALQKEIDDVKARKLGELRQMDAELKTLQAALETQPAGADRDAKEELLKKKTRDRTAFVDDGGVEMEKMTQRSRAKATAINEELQQLIMRPMAIVAHEHGLDLVLEHRTATAINPDFDISNEIIRKLDESERAGSASPTGAAAAPASPTASPKAKP